MNNELLEEQPIVYEAAEITTTPQDTITRFRQ